MARATWTESEDAAVIDLYKRLLKAQQQGSPLDITKEILKARELRGINKSKEAIRARLSNVSAVLEECGQPRVQNIGPWSGAAQQTERLVKKSLPWT